MPASPDQIAHARDLFGDLGDISTGGMFGGTALYAEGDVMFACILGGTIWMKSDATTRAAYETAGARPFTYAKAKGDQVVTSLMALPDSATDDPDEAIEWARLSYPPALAAAQKKRREKARKAARA
ncbi:TfoX/Sxy family protein [Celeribacter arenosi]|uniref:TfoX N-terminal domain-containing protein n=1 Tax=Celeribacter arenosi TaxID=792649 RepID=A0ABP7KFH2_9RHOB